MTPETLFRYCFAAVTGTGFGIILVVLIAGAIAGITGFGETQTSIDRERDDRNSTRFGNKQKGQTLNA